MKVFYNWLCFEVIDSLVRSLISNLFIYYPNCIVVLLMRHVCTTNTLNYHISIF